MNTTNPIEKRHLGVLSKAENMKACLAYFSWSIYSYPQYLIRTN